MKTPKSTRLEDEVKKLREEVDDLKKRQVFFAPTVPVYIPQPFYIPWYPVTIPWWVSTQPYCGTQNQCVTTTQNFGQAT